MTTYRLHYFPESGNSYKLALMLTLCGARFEPVWTDFGSGVTWTPAWRATVNAMGEIPVLEEDGTRLTQTAPILLRLAERFARFQGSTDAVRYEVLRWLFWDNQKLSGFMAAYRYRRAFTPDTKPDVLDFLRKRVDDFLGILERRSRWPPFVAGGRADGGRPVHDRLPVFPKHESGYDLPATPPGDRRLAAADRGAAGLAGAI